MQEPETESPAEEVKSGWNFHTETDTTGDQEADPGLTVIDSGMVVSWTASEYIAHQKDKSWYVMAGAAALFLSIAIFFITDHSIFNSILILMASGVFIAVAARPPRVLDYSVDSSGLTISGKLYGYDKFKSFSLVSEGPINSIMLQPLERLMPNMSLYFDPKDEKKIVEVLGMHLPYEEHQLAPVDKLMRKIRF